MKVSSLGYIDKLEYVLPYSWFALTDHAKFLRVQHLPAKSLNGKLKDTSNFSLRRNYRFENNRVSPNWSTMCGASSLAT